MTDKEPSFENDPETQGTVSTAPLSRRDLMKRGMAHSLGLAAAGAVAGKAAAGERPTIRIPILKPNVLEKVVPEVEVSALKTVDLPKPQLELMQGATVLPTPGRLTVGGTLQTVAGNPESPSVRTLIQEAARPKEEGGPVLTHGINPNYNDDGSRRNNAVGRPDYRVRLLCRTFAGDIGTRPLAPEIVFWESPDIWVEGPGGEPDRARAGVVNKVKVHVWNVGLAPCYSAHVDLYWCNPSVGVNAAAARPIGSQVVTLLGGEHRIVTFDWTPVVENDGHECLVAQISDPLSDPLVAPFNPKADRHSGQRNVTVLKEKAGASVSLGFFTPNLSRERAVSTLEVERVSGAGLKTMALTLGKQNLMSAPVGSAGITAPDVRDALPVLNLQTVPAGSVFRETLKDAPAVKERRQIEGNLRTLTAPVKGGARLMQNLTPSNQVGALRISRRELLSADRILNGLRQGELAIRRQAEVEPGKELRMALAATIPEGAISGTAQVYRVVERVNGEITGGITVVVETQ
jgi:hypothetical protein